MKRCAKCGNTLVDDRATFCDQCGYDLRETRLQLNDLKQMSSEVTGQVVALSINTNQFYMQGFSGVIHLKAKNLKDESLDSVVVKALSNVPIKNNSWHFELAPGETRERKFQLTPPRWKGNELIQFEVTVKKGSTASIYEAQATLCILERIEDAKEIELHTGNIDFGQESEKFNIGGVINVDIKNMIDRGQIKNANDLMREYEKLLPAFCPLNLEFRGSRYLYSPLHGWKSLILVAVIALGFVIIGSLLVSDGKPEEKSRARQAWQDALLARLELEDLQVNANQHAGSICKEAERTLQQAEQTFDKGDYIRAEKSFKIAKQKFEKAKNIVEAEPDGTEKKLDTPGEETIKLLDEARTYVDKGFLDGARKIVEQVLALHSENKEAEQLLAEINRKIEQKEERSRKKEQINQWWKN